MSFPRALGPLAVAIAFATGIVLAPALDRLGVDPWLRWTLAAALATYARRHPAIPLAAVIAAGAARAAASRVELPAGVIADDRIVDRLVGVVRGPIVRTAHGAGAELDTDTAAVWLWSEQPLTPGELVAVAGVVRSARGFRGPAQPEHTGYELTAQAITRLGDAPGVRDRIWRWAEATQVRWAAAIDEAGGDPLGRAALRGIAVGDRSDVPASLDDRWRTLGIYHVLSVSGLHLAVIAGLAFTLLRRLIAAAPWGGRVHPARWAAPPALAIAIAYTLVTGAQLATLRALIVVGLMFLGAMLDRPVRLIDALGVAAGLILAWHPADLADPSFQLSFTAALTLALRPASTTPGIRGWLTRGIAASLWITITTAPITAFHFQQVAAGGIVGNLVLTPLLELFALPLVLAGIALGSLGAPLVRLATWLVTEIDRGGALLARVTPVGHIAVASTAALAILVVLSMWHAARPPGTRTRLDAMLWLALCGAWWLARDPAPPNAMRVTFLDVGQGDAALIELPDGAVWLVDAGGIAGARGAAATAPGDAIDRALAVYEHDRIDLAIVSHPHPDHYLGFLAIDTPIRELWSAAEPEPYVARVARGPLTSFADVTTALAARGTVLGHPPLGVVRREAGVDLVVWAPRYHATEGAPGIEAADPVRTVNDNSLVVELRYRGRAIAFVGDIEHEGEQLLVAAGLAHVDVVKVPHHGSPTSSSAAFVAATSPELAVISCGRGNSFGFPSPAVIDRWHHAGADVARTDLEGAITIVIDAAGGMTVDRFSGRAP
jgi:competence protein ComEC